MIRYPRVLIIKRIKYIPIYQELYQVDSLDPNTIRITLQLVKAN